jgi:hypothetical protein
MNDNRLSALLNLKSSDGWQLLRSEVLTDVERIEEELFKIADNSARFTSHDVNRLLRQHLLDLIELPNRLIVSYGGSIEQESNVKLS